MNIAVYCASRPGHDPAFARDACEVGRWIGGHGHTLVYGGSHTGLMGQVASGCLDAGGEVIGVIPEIPELMARKNPLLSRVIVTRDMADRRSEMIRLADGFIALPGGLGTFDEVTEVLSLKSLDLVKGKVAFFDTLGYYAKLKDAFRSILEHGFGEEAYFSQVGVVSSVEELESFFNAE